LERNKDHGGECLAAPGDPAGSEMVRHRLWRRSRLRCVALGGAAAFGFAGKLRLAQEAGGWAFAVLDSTSAAAAPLSRVA
jgi:hypothetical protein